MIRVIETHNIQDKKKALSNFNLQTDTLLVASLNDKIFWRNYYLQTTDILTDDAIQRASDFWDKLLLYIPKSYKLVSSAFLKTYLGELVVEKQLHLQSDTLYRLLLDFQDILYAEDIHDIFEDWIKENINPQAPWLHHIDDLKLIISILEEKGWVCRELLPALLYKYRENIAVHLQNKNIFVSLDFSLSVIETKLIMSLASSNSLTVLIPIVKPIQNFFWDYQIYKPLSEDSSLLTQSSILQMLFSPKKLNDNLHLSIEKIQYQEFETIINEIHFVIGKIRALLESGVPLKDIAILSPNKDRYTLAFDTFLQLEGLHSQSTQDSSLLGLKNLQYLIGKLKIKIKEIESEDLELQTYFREPVLPYNQFAREFTNLYQESEADRLLHMQNLKISSANDTMDKFLFIDWFLEQEENLDVQPFTGLLNDVPDKVVLKKSSWIKYLQQILQTKFLRKSTIHDGVMQVLDILESSLQQDKYVFVLGVNDKDLREQQNSFMEQTEIEKLALELGLVFPSHFSQSRLLAILQILQESNQVYMSYAHTDINGDLLEHSLFHYLLPKSEDSVNSFVSQSMYTDEKYPLHRNIHVPWQFKKLSATHIESYIRCPFIYYSKNVLKLTDQDALDLDIDPMTNGNIIHLALSYFLQEDAWPVLTENKIENLLQKAIDHYLHQIKEAHLVTAYKIKAIEYLKSFMKFEQEWRATHVKTKTAFVEHEITAFLDRNGYFYREDGAGRFPFTAKLDRIDTDGNGNYLIIDYKFRLSSQHTNIATWFSKGSLQLAIYAMLLEDIKAFEDLQTVVGAIYYSLKPLQREKGFLLKANSNLYPIQARKRVYIEEEQKQAYFTNLRELLKKTIQQIEAGNFSPQPLNVSDCEKCYWRNTCRAPHLN